MKSRQPRPRRRTATCSLVIAVAATLAMSACSPAEDPAAVPEFEQELAEMVGDPATRRPTFALTLDVPGEWVGGKVIDTRGRILSFVATEDGPRAVIAAPHRVDGYAVFAPFDGTWRRESEWRVDDLWQSVSTYVAIGNEVIAVGPNRQSPVDKPWSFVVGADSEAPPLTGDGFGEVRVHKAAAGNGDAMAIGRRLGRATAWHSTDGKEWNEVALPIEGSLRQDLKDVIFANDRWIIVAHHKASRPDPQQLVVLTSDDGVLWQQATLEPPPTDVKPLGQVVLGHDGSNVQVLAYAWSNGGWAIDDGFTWASADGTTWGPPLPVAPGTFGTFFGPLMRQPTVDATVVRGLTRHRSDYRYCFETDQPCQSNVHALWVPDGEEWSMLVPPDIRNPQASAIIDDVLYVGGEGTGDGPGTSIYRWSPEAGDNLPHAAPIDTTPPKMTLPLVPDGPLEGGVVYAQSLRLLAPDPSRGDGRVDGGFGCMRLDDQEWELGSVEPDAIEIIHASGAVADDRLFASIELVGHDRIEVAVPGYGVLGYLSPRPAEEWTTWPCSMAANI